MHVHFCGFSYYHKLPKIRLLFAHYFEANEGGRLLEYSIYSWILRSAQSMRSTSEVGTIRTRLEERQLRWTCTTGNQRRLWWIKPRGIDRLVATGDSPAYTKLTFPVRTTKYWSLTPQLETVIIEVVQELIQGDCTGSYICHQNIN